VTDALQSAPGLVPGCEFSYCPGCSHSVTNRILGQLVVEMGIQGRTVLVGPVGCSEMVVFYIDVDAVSAAHGRAPAVAVGIKRCRPECIVVTHQGDGDFAAIGFHEALGAAQLGEPVTMIWVNNATYGMTGGQMGPSTLVGQKTKTSPQGRSARLAGTPFHATELLAALPGVAFAERVGTDTPAHIAQAKAAIRRALEVQAEGRGAGVVEVLGICPTGWGMSVKDAFKWYQEHLMAEFPLGRIVDRSGGERGECHG
jgi:2-oxoglutarate/2-oxoacid ferredoxin oxidoreductase subunit beta